MASAVHNSVSPMFHQQELRSAQVTETVEDWNCIHWGRTAQTISSVLPAGSVFHTQRFPASSLDGFVCATLHTVPDTELSSALCLQTRLWIKPPQRSSTWWMAVWFGIFQSSKNSSIGNRCQEKDTGSEKPDCSPHTERAALLKFRPS